MSIHRHFAFFSQTDGSWIREWSGPVPEPNIDSRLVGEAREMALNEWATAVSCPQPGEIGLDVTHAEWPVGDFVWARFDAIRRAVDWPTMHQFVVIDRESGLVCGHTESSRPVRSNAAHIVLDVTEPDGAPVPMLPDATASDLIPVASKEYAYAAADRSER